MYKKVGTISSALGLIFLGIWMIISKNNSVLSQKLFSWWYVIFILLGIEMIFFYGISKSTEKRGFNFLFVFVVLIFITIDIFKGAFLKYPNISSVNFQNNLESVDYWDDHKYKSSDFTRECNTTKEICVNTDNSYIVIKRSDINKIKITGKIYYNAKDKAGNYDVRIKNDNDISSIDINDSEIEGIKAEIYVPDGCKLKFKCDNIKLECSEKNLKADYDIEADNGVVTIDNDAQNIYTNIDNGLVKVNNKLSKNVDITLDNGMVTFNTENKNLSLDINTDKGLCKCNDLTMVNYGIKKEFGVGSDRLKIYVDNGTITAKVAESYEE